MGPLLLFFLACVVPASSKYHSLHSLYIRDAPNVFPNNNRSVSADPASTHSAPSRWESIFSSRQIAGPAFSSGPNDTEVLVALINGEEEAVLSFIFVPGENFTIEDYELVPSMGNLNILDEEDVETSYVADASQGFLAYNVTAEIDFNKWTGISTFALQAINKSTSEVEAFSDNADLVVVGITFYTVNEFGESVLIGGPAYPLTLTTDDVSSSLDYNLNVFIQYFDRTTSNETLTVPLDTVDISTSSLNGQLAYDETTCSAVGGTYDGEDVELPEGCGVGFSTNSLNSIYVGPFLGLDLIPYQNGSFTVSFEWNELVEGSDLELEGYATYIDVSVVGEIPPVVTLIVPDGPFRTVGTDKAIVHVENLPQSASQLKLWTYDLSIDFGSEISKASYDKGSAVIFSNGTVSLTFTLPSGSGTDLPWNLTVTKPTSEVLSALDETDPSYLFTFIDLVDINSISPDSGPEEGGTVVSLLGEFSSFNSDSISIFFDETPINSSLILSTSDSNITFQTPSMESIGTDFSVTVVLVIDDITSNEVIFTYLSSVELESMNPSSGPSQGGTEVTLTGQFPSFNPASQNSGVYFDGIRIDPSLITSSNSSVIIFNSPSQDSIGSTSKFSYDVSVQISGISSNSLEFVYDGASDSPISITSITPSSGDKDGGTEVLLTGTFEFFDPQTSALFFGGLQIPPSEIQYNETSLLFSTPPLSEVGSAYTQDVYVVIGLVASNVVQFTYEDTGSSVTIIGGGGSIDPATGYYQVGVCSDSLYRASISNGARFQNPVYKWTLTTEGSSADILGDIGIVATSEVLYIPYSAFPKEDAPYTLSLAVQTSYTSFEKTQTVIKLSAQRIGVRINDPKPRSFSDPNVTLTIPAELFLPGCREKGLEINSTAMTFVWVFRDEVHVFSYTNTTAPELEVSPTLLGREFHIPQSLMEYGTFGISLEAYFTERESVRGSDSTTVVITPTSLRPQINGGEYSQFISASRTLSLTAARSRDPDVLDGDDTANLEYSWSCQYAWDESMQNAVDCGDGLMPSSAVSDVEFSVSPEDLSNVQNTSTVHIEYTLRISKTSVNATGDEITRSSDPVTSQFILSEERDELFEALEEVSIVNNQSIVIDLSNVKYYEDVTITPISRTTETTWTFEVISPPSQSRTLLASDENLLTLPGYFTSGTEAGRLSLGFKANVLDPSTEYRILITTFHPEYAVNEHVISLTTVEKPTVALGSLVTPSGSTADVFVLSAYTSYEGDFKFFFLLTDEYGFESCVGGCQGENVVKFRLATAGRYSVRCEVYDWIGFTLLANATGENITVSSVTAAEEGLSELYAEAFDAFLAGDHATYQQLGIDMVKSIWFNGGSVSEEVDSDILANYTEGMNQIASNAIPNAVQSAKYVSIAASLASLTPSLGVTYEMETLYYLVNITVSAIERVPDNGALQVIEELLQFYDLTPALVLEAYPQGTTRQRLLQRALDIDTEILEIWLDLYEVMKEQIAVSLLKKCSCGCVEEVSTGILSPTSVPFSSGANISTQSRVSAAASYVNPNQGRISRVSIKVAHFCNSEQGSRVTVAEGAEGEVHFSWCKDIFEDSIKRLYFALAVTPDYIYLSRLHQNTTLTDGLVATMIATINGNGLQDATLPIKDCYQVRLPILRNLTSDSEGVPEEEVPRGLTFTPSKEWGQNSSTALYIPVFSDIATSFSDSAATADTEFTTAILRMSTTGVFTVATRAAWSSAIFSFEGILLLAAEITGVVVLIFALVVIAIASTWLIATRLFAATGFVAPVEADFTYVERDVYGRGTALAMMEEQDALTERWRAGGNS